MLQASQDIPQDTPIPWELSPAAAAQQHPKYLRTPRMLDKTEKVFLDMVLKSSC